ncbi:DNA-binding response regulator, NarL/FixJ family, contains REC and HTH domains [Cellulophaga tyrosinoxydans]|uniref:DNA-binding response regulator, NarL/FixJ family, contains REC and HTH domains n=2 Tax=Cellulophaga tyrosinoxydans TaxID=504486 RepID=A0A1W2BI16_9FLAO|nr:DNA-binding response regulator, NarL/FixJ family, contains REC and HTH domains [Cellulophaga tyrosinoxydans]
MLHNPISILIVDDHPMVIEGLKTLLAGDARVHIKNHFTNGKDTLDFFKMQSCDIVLLDVNLPDINGVEMVGLILSLQPKVGILGLSTYSEPSIINQMIRNGVKGYLLKNATARELIEAISQVHSGKFYFGSEIQKILADSLSQESKDTPKLTRREKHILQLIADGKTTNAIADELFISPLTVETHRRNLMQKLEVSNAASLIKIAIEKKLI